jgi:hypothetical protein
LLETIGISPDEGVLRLSFVHYTAVEYVRQLIKALDESLSSTSGMGIAKHNTQTKFKQIAQPPDHPDI